MRWTEHILGQAGIECYHMAWCSSVYYYVCVNTAYMYVYGLASNCPALSLLWRPLHLLLPAACKLAHGECRFMFLYMESADLCVSSWRVADLCFSTWRVQISVPSWRV